MANIKNAGDKIDSVGRTISICIVSHMHRKKNQFLVRQFEWIAIVTNGDISTQNGNAEPLQQKIR